MSDFPRDNRKRRTATIVLFLAFVLFVGSILALTPNESFEYPDDRKTPDYPPTLGSPVSNQPSDISSVAGEPVAYIIWKVFDADSDFGYYTVYRNGSFYRSEGWVNASSIYVPIYCSITGTDVYTIEFSDGINDGQDTVYHFISPNQAPVSNHPSDTMFLKNEPNAFIHWSITDVDNDYGYYNLLINGTVKWSNQGWVNDTSLYIAVDTVTDGYYNYTIVFTDGFSHVSDSVWCQVISNVTPPIPVINTAPVSNHPPDVFTYKDDPITYIEWIIHDAENMTGTYSVTSNGSPYQSGNWLNGTIVFVPVYSPGVGNTTYTINFTDGEFNVTDTVEHVVLMSGKNCWLFDDPNDYIYDPLKIFFIDNGVKLKPGVTSGVIVPKYPFVFVNPINGFDVKVLTPSGTEARFQVSSSAGSTWEFWNGTHWDISDLSKTESNDESTVDTNIYTLDTSGSFLPRVTLYSSGSKTPFLKSIYLI